MKLSEFIEELTEMKDLYGDIPVVVADDDEAPHIEHQDAEDDLVEAIVIS